MATLLEEIRSRKKSDNSQSQESEIPTLEEFTPTRTLLDEIRNQQPDIAKGRRQLFRSITPQAVDDFVDRFPSETPLDELFKDVPGGVEGARGVADVVLSGATSVIPAIGNVVGTVEGFGKALSDGSFGTQEGARDIQRTAEQRAEAFGRNRLIPFYEPTSEAGKQLQENLGRFAGRYLPPILSGGPSQFLTGRQPTITKKEETANRIRSGDESAELAKTRIPDPEGFTKDKTIEKDREAIETIKQGLDESTVQMLKQASIADKERMLEMLNLRSKGLTNKRDEQLNRAHDIPGTALLNNIKKLKIAKTKAGQDVDKEANTLRGVSIDGDEEILNIGRRFINDLSERLNIKFDENLNPIFEGTTRIEKNPTSMKLVKDIFDLAKNPKDAKGLHDLKQAVNEKLNYDKAQPGGIAGNTEQVIKDFNRDINNYLRNKSDSYAKANDNFSILADAIDSIESVTGKKTDFDSITTGKQLGTLLRRLTGNAVSRSKLLDAINKVQTVGGVKDQDLFTLTIFAESLDDVLDRPSAMTSFRGDLQRGVESGVESTLLGQPTMMQTGINLAKGATNRVRGINQENALQSIRNLLERDLRENRRRQSKSKEIVPRD
tara:strand:- start:43 stop:1863 length:1821 start_codon:yes stop_codon:yes gene_type:complete